MIVFQLVFLFFCGLLRHLMMEVVEYQELLMKKKTSKMLTDKRSRAAVCYSNAGSINSTTRRARRRLLLS